MIEKVSWLIAFGWAASEWVIRLAMLVYVPQRRAPAAARTWLLLIFFLPWLGLLLYGIFGRVYYPSHRRKKLAQINQAIVDFRAASGGPSTKPCFDDPLSDSTARLVETLGFFSTRGGNAIELFDDYEETLASIIRDIEAAKRRVDLLMYIYAADEVGRRMTEALLRAASRGVKCRVLLDGIGAKGGLQEFRGPLLAAGVEVIELLPPSSLLLVLAGKRARLDLRNHRKIIVIDGRVGYIGSQNIIDAMATTGTLPNEELVARVSGPAVTQLQAVILADLYLETGRSEYEIDSLVAAARPGDVTAQMLPSGPAYGTPNAHMVMVTLIHQARERVVITTPYFVPDESFLEALQTACYRGVEVHLILSRTLDQGFTQAAQEAYYETLLQAGVRIHLYRPAFLHAKHVTIDDTIAMVGSANMDIRSFILNAEAALMLYDRGVVAQIAEVQARYMANADEVDLARWKERPLLRRSWQNLCRLADSLL